MKWPSRLLWPPSPALDCQPERAYYFSHSTFFKKLILQISSTVRQLSNASNKECSLRRMRGTDQITLNQAINGTLINGSLSEIWFT